MPPTTNSRGQAIAGSFLGLQSYTEAQSNLFFGRDAETDTLTSLIELNTLTIVFGKSGTGKTSLLNAGVFPRLRKSFCLPFRIRLEFNDNSPGLIAQVKKVLKEEIDKYGFRVESYPSSETLWEYFHKEPLWKTVIPILVFDQFEEIFTLAKSNPRFAAAELPVFWEELSNLIENHIPEKLKESFLNQKEKIEYNYKKRKAKIVFSFREEYLPEFETLAAKIPSLKYSRFRLLPMNGNQAFEVITKTWKENINTKEARHLVSYFTNEPGIDDYSFVTVEPSLLSQVCAHIDKERIESGGGKVSAELLNKYPKETILRSIYDEAVTAADNSLNLPKEKEVNKNLIKIFVEEKLITTEGYRTRYNLSATDEILKPGINVLTTKYFLREDDNVVELTHDVLAPIIKTDREKRRKETAIKAVRKKARKRALLLLLLAFLIGSGSYYLITRKALSDKRVITQQTARLRGDSLRLAKVTDSLNHVYRNIDSLLNHLPPSVQDSIKEKFDDLRRVADSLKEEYIELKVDYDKRLESADIRRPRMMRMPKIVLPNIDSMENLLLIEKNKYDSILAEYIKLKKLFDNYTNRFPDPLPITDKSMATFDTTNSLRVKLYYGNRYNTKLNPPDNLTIYLIPYSSINSRVIKNARVYEINCDESDLQKAEGLKTAIFRRGYYYFPDVESGKYLIKICTYYGGFYTYTKRSAGIETINWDASPPIR